MRHKHSFSIMHFSSSRRHALLSPHAPDKACVTRQLLNWFLLQLKSIHCMHLLVSIISSGIKATFLFMRFVYLQTWRRIMGPSCHPYLQPFARMWPVNVLNQIWRIESLWPLHFAVLILSQNISPLPPYKYHWFIALNSWIRFLSSSFYFLLTESFFFASSFLKTQKHTMYVSPVVHATNLLDIEMFCKILVFQLQLSVTHCHSVTDQLI